MTEAITCGPCLHGSRDSVAEIKANPQETPANWKKMLSHKVLREGTPEIILITKKACFNNTLPEVRNISVSTEK